MFAKLAFATMLGLTSIHSALALGNYAPTPRWGQKAVYVEGTNTVYYVGGEVAASGTQITNEVLVLPLNTTNPGFLTGPSTNLPAVAFGTLAVHESSGSAHLYYSGGLTSSCSSDAVIHEIDVGSAAGETSWSGYTPSGLVRRRGAGSFWSTGGSAGNIKLVGGMMDDYVCSSGTYAYQATDSIAVPVSLTSTPSTTAMPANLFGGSSLPVVDFAIASRADGSAAYLGGGADKNGDLVSFQTIAMWDNSKSTWTSLKTTGDVPAGRAGHNMVLHPTQNLLIFHGGAVPDSSGTLTASPLLAILSLDNLTWSLPSNLEPPASAARAWHSSVMTSTGVMISAFGLDSSNSPRNDVVYLDMSYSDVSKWTWKSQWSTSMGVAATSTGKVATATGTTAYDAASTAAAHKSTLLKSTLIPILVVLILASPILIYLARRHVRNVRRRRMARHFELDGDHQSKGSMFSNVLGQWKSSGEGRRRYSSFADMLPHRSSAKTEAGFLAGLLTRLRLHPNPEPKGDALPSREMMQVGANGSNTPRVQWEEIDFGLGRVDEQRRGSATPDPRSRSTTPKALGALKSSLSGRRVSGAEGESPLRVSFKDDDSASEVSAGETGSSLPAVHVQTATPMDTPMEEATGTPLSVLEYPILRPVDVHSPAMSSPTQGQFTTAPGSPAVAPAVIAQAPDWSDFARDLAARPLFSGPPSRTAENPFADSAASPTVLPPLEFQRHPSSGSGLRVAVDPRERRASASSARSVSSPIGPGRDLTSTGRRVSASSASGRTIRAVSPAPLAHDAYASLAPAVTVHRLSNPPPFPPPMSPMPHAPAAATETPARRTSNRSTASASRGGESHSKRGSQDSRLRVVNVSPNPAGRDDFSGQAM